MTNTADRVTRVAADLMDSAAAKARAKAARRSSNSTTGRG